MLHTIALLITALLPIDDTGFVTQECLNSPAPAHDRSKLLPDDLRPENQHFCCNSVNSNDGGSGEDCTAISKELINSCTKVLYCAGGWTKEDGVVNCL
ncbi:MAG: hypothetical protein R6X02_34265 [Enhygromyxa sp.]